MIAPIHLQAADRLCRQVEHEQSCPCCFYSRMWEAVAEEYERQAGEWEAAALRARRLCYACYGYTLVTVFGFAAYVAWRILG